MNYSVVDFMNYIAVQYVDHTRNIKPRFSVATVFNGAPIFYLSEPEVPFARCRRLTARSG